MVFLNSPKKHILWPFLAIFGHFCRWGFFPKNQALIHNHILAPKIMLSFVKKLMRQQSRRKYGQTERRTEGRTGRPYFIAPVRSRQVVQKYLSLRFWGLETSSGPIGPKSLSSYNSKTLAPIFTSRASFYRELKVEFTQIKSSKIC